MLTTTKKDEAATLGEAMGLYSSMEKSRKQNDPDQGEV
jgi:hypothetical protein